jgi:hypothetical protein
VRIIKPPEQRFQSYFTPQWRFTANRPELEANIDKVNVNIDNIKYSIDNFNLSYIIDLEIQPNGSFFLEASVESVFGLETMGKSDGQAGMRDVHEKQILTLARIEHNAQNGRTFWYAPFLTRLGEILVDSGSWLQARYSLHRTNPAH